MSTVTEILEAVKQLPEEQKEEFLDRLSEVDFEDAWDRRIEADAKAGRRTVNSIRDKKVFVTPGNSMS